jgi:hypothetical protein
MHLALEVSFAYHWLRCIEAVWHEEERRVEPEQPWADLNPEQRLERRFQIFANPGIPFATPEAEAAYKARADRLRDAILLEKTPDRVPVCTFCQFYPAHRAGITPYDVLYDREKAAEAWLTYGPTLEPDAFVPSATAAVAGPLFDLLDFKLFSWPGHGVSRDAGFQYIEREWMLPEEYDLLIDDPTDFLLHTYLPRTNGALAGLASLEPPVGMAQICGAGYWLMAWGRPEAEEAMSCLLEAGRLAAAWAGWSFGLDGRLMAEGFPPQFGLVTWAPFDYLGDTLRGTRGIVTDLFRRPEKVQAACERLTRVLVKAVVRKAAPFVPPLVFIPLHKGADGFMSEEQFRTFYWPSLREVCLGLIEQGLVPYLFAEGSYDSRLPVIADLPAARTVWHFDQTDMRRAKGILGGIACIQGNVPLSLLQLGKVEDVTAYCRELIDDVKGDGGFILDMGAGADTGKEENFKAMIQAAKVYGVY